MRGSALRAWLWSLSVDEKTLRMAGQGRGARVGSKSRARWLLAGGWWRTSSWMCTFPSVCLSFSPLVSLFFCSRSSFIIVFSSSLPWLRFVCSLPTLHRLLPSPRIPLVSLDSYHAHPSVRAILPSHVEAQPQPQGRVAETAMEPIYLAVCSDPTAAILSEAVIQKALCTRLS